MSALFKAALITAGLMTLQLISYFGTQFVAGKPVTVGCDADERIPFIPGFIYAYVSWYPLVLLFPLLLFAFSRVAFARYVLAYATVLVIALVVYLVFPTTLVRPEPSPKGVTGWLITKIYSGDYRILCCVPSLHCASSFCFIISMLACSGIPAELRIFIVLWAALIIASTLFVKQHMLIDVVTALPTALAGFLLAYFITPERFLEFFAFA